MPIITANFSCHGCGHHLAEQDIARAHFLKKCPACNDPIELDAPGALTRSRAATAAGLAGMVMGLGTWVVALTAWSIDEKTLETWPSKWQAGLAISVVGTSMLLAYVFQRIQVRAALARMRKQLEAEALL